MNRRLLQHSMRSLRRYKLRSAFIMLGSFVGATVLTLILAAGHAAERKVLRTVEQLFGASTIVVMAGGTQLMTGPRPDSARLTIDDLEAVVDAIPGIEAWDPQQAIPAATIRHGRATATARILGHSERAELVWNRTVSRGAFFDTGSIRSSERVALIGETVASELFGTGDPIGRDIVIANVPFRVQGVLQRFGTDVHGLDRDDEIVVPITTMMRRMMNVDSIATAKLLVREGESVDDAAKTLKEVLRARHGRQDFAVITATGVQRMVAKTQRILSLYLPLVAGITLLVGAIVASSLMLAAVNERTNEIGLRRAVGAGLEEIQLQFLTETAATMVLGGVAGILAGLVAAQLVAAKLHLDAVSPWRAMGVTLAVTLLTGLVAGVIPARRAAKLDPATALR
jgi:putative ABC transport system permease protein